jgi:uncharacterized lipoprotein YddW (UPF0748 family)
LYVDAFHPGIRDHQQVTRLVSAARAGNFNALIVQIRKRGDVYYNSLIEPKAQDVASDYDPLADVTQQAHAVGIEVHAWLSVLEVSHEKYLPAASHVAVAHEDWLTAEKDGSTAVSGGKVCLDPGVPAVRAYVVSLVRELVSKYDVDGVHFDNLMYPGLASGYNPVSVELFNQESGVSGLPDPNDPAWGKWRRRQVTSLLAELRQSAIGTRPGIKVSASVALARPTLAATHFMQEWDAWTREGLVDFVIPMLYDAEDRMAGEAGEALRSAGQRHVYIGIGGYRITPDRACEQISAARACGAPGIALYSYHYLNSESPSNSCAKIEDLRSCAFVEASAIPLMPWR